MSDSYILSGVTAILAERLLHGASVVVVDGAIKHIGGESLAECLAANSAYRDLPIEECPGSVLAPRLVETHIHGAFGIGFESVRGGEDMLAVARGLESRGVGCFVPTILWDEKAVGRLIDAIEESGLSRDIIPGIYIEGPFINPERRGGITPPHIAEPDEKLCRKIIEATREWLRIMALAPELPGIQALYPILREAGVRISLGHSGASAGVALPPPPFSVTHLYNAMSGLDHRGGGLANIALAGLSTWAELNADGIHVNATGMKIAALCLPPEKLILTSDAVVSAGLGYGDYSYFGKAVSSDASGVRYRDTGTLIGSNKLGMEIVKSFMEAAGASLPDAVASMSRAPAALLGLPAGALLGIEEGAAADFFIWDEGLSVCRKPGSASRTAHPAASEISAKGTEK